MLKPAYQYEAKVVSVYDGDTFTFDVDLGFHIQTRIKARLARINTPEVRGPEKVSGIEVRDFVRDLLKTDDTVLITTKKTGKFGRWITEVWLADGVNLTDLLLSKNMGRHMDDRGRTLADPIL